MNTPKPKPTRIVDREVLMALRTLRTQNGLLKLRTVTRLGPDAVLAALDRLSERGLVNLHYAELDNGGRCLRYIVPVDIVPRRKRRP